MKPCTAHDNTQADQSPKQDVYASITAKIVAALEDGVRPWVTPWNAEHAAGRITRPLRHNGQPYTGINVLSLWASASVQRFAAPIWMTYRQAVELGAHVRKGEKGSPVVYANSITRSETDADSGVDVARDIHFLKGYTVFNVEQIDGLPAQYTAPASPRLDVSARIARAECFFGATGATLAHVMGERISRCNLSEDDHPQRGEAMFTSGSMCPVMRRASVALLFLPLAVQVVVGQLPGRPEGASPAA
jgi:antirestriction protein ArdC